jgi:F0F1-type ATP synthase assembly protein I
MGFTFVIAVLLFGGLGWLVDGWLDTRPLFAIAGGFFGGVAWFLNLYYRVRREIDEKKRGTGSGERGA